MGCGMSTASGRRSYKRVHGKTKKHDIFIETLPRRMKPGDRHHAQYPLGPDDLGFRWPTNNRGVPSEEADLSEGDSTRRMYVGSGKARMAFVVRRVAAHDKDHELGKQVERDDEGEPIEDAVGLPMGSRYKGRTAGWEPYENGFGSQFRGGRFFDPLPKDEDRGPIEGGNQPQA